MKYLRLFSLTLGLFAVCACNLKNELATPEPDFKVINDSCQAPCEMAFSNLTKDAGFQYFWNFNDVYS